MRTPRDTNPTRNMSGVQVRSSSLRPKYPSDSRPLLIVCRISALDTIKVQDGSKQGICVDGSTYS